MKLYTLEKMGKLKGELMKIQLMILLALITNSGKILKLIIIEIFNYLNEVYLKNFTIFKVNI